MLCSNLGQQRNDDSPRCMHRNFRGLPRVAVCGRLVRNAPICTRNRWLDGVQRTRIERINWRWAAGKQSTSSTAAASFRHGPSGNRVNSISRSTWRQRLPAVFRASLKPESTQFVRRLGAKRSDRKPSERESSIIGVPPEGVRVLEISPPPLLEVRVECASEGCLWWEELHYRKWDTEGSDDNEFRQSVFAVLGDDKARGFGQWNRRATFCNRRECSARPYPCKFVAASVVPEVPPKVPMYVDNCR